VGLGGGDGGREDVGGEGTCGLGADGSFFNTVTNDQGAGSEIAKALMIARDENRDHADCVGNHPRTHIDVPDEVAGHGFEEAYGASGALDDPDASDALAWGAAVVEGLKQREVAPVEQKDQEEIESSCPLRGHAVEGSEAWQEVGKDRHDNPDADAPDDEIDQKRDEAAADAGEGHVNGNEFRGIDAKLIRTLVNLSHGANSIESMDCQAAAALGPARFFADTIGSAGAESAFACGVAGDGAAVQAGGGGPLSAPAR